jgi:HKD family nuclease
MNVEDLKDGVKNGVFRGFIDRNIDALELYIPKFLTNSNNEKILTTIQSELRGCDEFMFSVAFITSGGVSVLSEELKTLRDRGIKGKIITSQYQNFTDPKALKRLKELGNIDV